MVDQTFEELMPVLHDILDNEGTFWGKFWCAHCGARQTFSEKNKLFTSGICEECGKTTKLDRWGLMVMLPTKKRKEKSDESDE